MILTDTITSLISQMAEICLTRELIFLSPIRRGGSASMGYLLVVG